MTDNGLKQSAPAVVGGIKAVIWDLDNTIWKGTLLEDAAVTLDEQTVEVIKELDRRGVLQSISSKNDFEFAAAKLRDLSLFEYFLFPEINWETKSKGVRKIAERLNIGIDTIAFVDDDPFEREEVRSSVPEILCLNVTDIPGMLQRPEFVRNFVTEDGANRRAMYRNDSTRNTAEDDFQGPKESFLRTLGLRLTIAKATEADLQRASELTIRTHQLNSTGHTYDYDELKFFMNSPNYSLSIASLEDKFGTYGKIGLCLIGNHSSIWTIKLLLLSCRVMSRGIGTVILSELIGHAYHRGARLQAEFLKTDRNRMMYIAYHFCGFEVIAKDGDALLLERKSIVPHGRPDHIDVYFDENCIQF